MADAAQLTVTITGDASGLTSAVSEAQSALSNLESMAQSAAGGFDNLDIAINARDNASPVISSISAAVNSLPKIHDTVLNGTDNVSPLAVSAANAVNSVPLSHSTTLTAVDNASGVARSVANEINSIPSSKTITINAVSSGASFAKGTKNAPGGLAMVNDEEGISDPRELIYHRGKYMMFGGKNVILPLERGDRVYTASQTKKIMKSMGVESYASGKNNEEFELWQDDFSHMKKTGNISLIAQIDKWLEAMDRFAYDAEAVRKAEEEIFSLTNKICDRLNDASDEYLSMRAYFDDWEEYGDTPLEAFERVKNRNWEYLEQGIIDWETYYENVSKIGADMYKDRKAASEEWLKQQIKYNGMSLDDYIAGLERMAAYTEEYYQNGIIDYKTYCIGLESINNDIYDARLEQAEAEQKQAEKEAKSVFDIWENHAKNWKMLRETYDDWEEYGDSMVEYYGRCIMRIDEMYKAGIISWQEYRDYTMEYQTELYKAQRDEIEQFYSDTINSMKSGWEVSDRHEDMNYLSGRIEDYSGAVTEKGKTQLKNYQEELEGLRREEEIYRLWQKEAAELESLREEYVKTSGNDSGIMNNIMEYVSSLVSGFEKMNYSVSTICENITAPNTTNVSTNNIEIVAKNYSELEYYINKMGAAIRF